MQGTIENIKSLKRGDVLLFLPPDGSSVFRSIVSSYQRKTFGQEKGYNVVHAAICTGNDAEGNPLIAHVTGNSQVKGYAQEKLQDCFDRDKVDGQTHGDRGLFVYRPKDEEVAKKIAEEAAKKRDLTWKASAGMKAMWQSRTPSQRSFQKDRIGLQQATVCSQFAKEVIVKSGVPLEAHQLSMPLDLANSLQSSGGFSKMLYPRKDPYKYLVGFAEKEAAKLATSSSSIDKHRQCIMAIMHAGNVLNDKEYTSLEKARIFLNIVAPVFGIRRGRGSSQTFKALMDGAANIGIYTDQKEMLEQLLNDKEILGKNVPIDFSTRDMAIAQFQLIDKQTTPEAQNMAGKIMDLTLDSENPKLDRIAIVKIIEVAPKNPQEKAQYFTKLISIIEQMPPEERKAALDIGTRYGRGGKVGKGKRSAIEMAKEKGHIGLAEYFRAAIPKPSLSGALIRRSPLPPVVTIHSNIQRKGQGPSK